jgi:hypothetical protein
MKIVVMRFMTIALNLAAKDKNNIDNGKKMSERGDNCNT